MSQVLLFWKQVSVQDNGCNLHSDHQNYVKVSLIIKNDSKDVLIINTATAHHKQLHKINFIDIDAIIIGIQEFNKEIFNEQNIKASNCLSIINTNNIIHLEFKNQSQRDFWMKYIHKHIIRKGKYSMIHETAIEYTLKHEQKDDIDEKKKDTKDINDIILTPHRLKRIALLLSGAYFRIPKVLSIRDIFNVFGSMKNEFQDEVFVTFAKQNVNATKYTHLLWTKRRNVTDSSTNVVYIAHIVSISINALNNKESNDEYDANIFFMKIIWKQHTELEPLILHHCDLDFLWYFAKALIYCCDAKGITMQQYRNAIKSSIQKKQKNKLNIFCGTYNVGTFPLSPQQSLVSWLKPNKSENIVPDLYAITLQEIVDLGKNLLTDHHHECIWEKAIYKVLSTKYIKIECIVRGALVLYLFAKKEIMTEITDIAYGALNVGLLGASNKAGAAIRVSIRNQSICFIGAHLPSGIEHCTLRNDMFYKIYRDLKFEGNHKLRDIEIQDHDVIFFFGDLNYRLNLEKSQIGVVYDLIEKGEIKKLLYFDQLNASKERNKIFEGFHEADVTFQPTYKYEPGTNRFETRKSKALRIPGFTDRILYEIRNKNNINVMNIRYDAVYSMSLSDHKPLYGLFEITVDDDDEDDEYSFKIKKIEFLQKNYKYHLMDGIRRLRMNQHDDKNDIIENIEQSQQELVSNMNALLKYLRTDHSTVAE